MATTDTLPAPQERQAHRRRPFSNWVKKLANFKSSSDGDRPRRNGKKKHGTKLNNPYPESGRVGVEHTAEESAASLSTPQTGSHITLEQTTDSAYHTERRTVGGRSVAGTVSTEHEGSTTAPSHGASSVAGTSRTVGGGVDSRRGGDSTFSSPAPSVRSLTTTLTTIQSTLVPNGAHHGTDALANNVQSVQFSQPFPTNSPASAIPAHLAPTGMPNTYTAATANGLLTDNASILTLASSSKRRRRRSMDTDASVRALAPSSVWGGSRESLPLSVLSANIESGTTPGLQASGSRLGAERSSIYSAVAGDRNSFYAKQGDAASVRSARPSHVRTDSVTTPGGTTSLNSPLVSQLPNEKFDENEKEEVGGPSPKENKATTP
ncbi:hypothetical protein V2G26_001369 [Clonostachys chloroleuca]|uniref:Uncharacterized protein n=1 Tax=Clonostachys chloroleuca TaxID=1926264 RepID=A0AA35QB20_9HYPO|nr:unnamed protein product [Clonostachys chloroleuca]